MNWLKELCRRCAFLLTRSQRDRDLEEEMQLHLDLRASERHVAGASPSAAASDARRQFGNVLNLREKSRDTWGWAWLDSLVQDIRYGLRMLALNPGFTFTAIISLALGIGANTAIFSIVNAVMIRSLPVEDPRQLVQLRMGRTDEFNAPLWREIRAHQQAFSGMLAYAPDTFNLSEGGEVVRANGIWVSPEFFSVLGVAPLRGRVFNSEDDARGSAAVISHSFWVSHFGEDRAIVGKTIRLNRHQFEIIGVAPPWFTGLDVDRPFDVAITLGSLRLLNPDRKPEDEAFTWWLRILGRLSPGVTVAEADARMKAIAPEVFRAASPRGTDYSKNSLDVYPAAKGFSAAGSRYRNALFALMAVVGLVLLIACANIANLLIARSAARQREVTIRIAIGAGRTRVIRQLVTECLLLSVLGAAAGLLFAQWGARVLVNLLSTARNPVDLDLSLDLTVLAFTTAIAMITGLLFGLAPAFAATRVSARHALNENARGTVHGSSRFHLSKALVAAQVALSLTLLIVAGLFIATMRNLLNAPLGFDRHNVMLVYVNTQSRVPSSQRIELYSNILERLRSIPGVATAATSYLTPITDAGWAMRCYPEGFQPASPPDSVVFLNRVSPAYFQTMDTALLMGRDFSQQDSLTSRKVLILNESAARRFFAGNPLGRTVEFDVIGRRGVREAYEVIGVVRDAKYNDIREKTRVMAYFAVAQEADPPSAINLEVRISGKVPEVLPNIRSAIAGVDAGLSVEFRSLETQVADSLTQERTMALLSTFFGALALLLATIGLYGVTSYTVLRRRSEIGVRMALGATRASVIWLVLRDVVMLLIAGTVAGLIAAVAAGRLAANLLYGLEPTDLRTTVLAIAILAIATLIAGYLPASRASRLDPSTTLRD